MSRLFRRALSTASSAVSASAPAPASIPAAATTTTANTTTATHRHYQRIIPLWPTDKLRPDTNFADVVLRGRERRALGDVLVSQASPSPSSSSPHTSATSKVSTSTSTPTPTSTSTSTSSASTQPTASTASTTVTDAVSPAKELCEINALYALLDNRFSKKYPVGAECLRPQSNPTYYEDLMRDFEEAPTRRWWQLWILKLKGKFRFR